MTKDISNIEETLQALDDIRLKIEKYERFEKQLQLHHENLLTSSVESVDIENWGKGWLPDSRDERDHDAPEIIKIDNSEIPMTFGSSNKHIIEQSKFTPIKNQGSIGSCTAFAGCSQLEYYVKRKTGNDVDLSELFLYLETRRNLGWEDRDSGAYLRTTMKTMASVGTCLEKEWPYNTAKYNEDPPAFVYPRADDYKADSY